MDIVCPSSPLLDVRVSISIVFPLIYTVLNQSLKPDDQGRRSDGTKKCSFYLMITVLLIDLISKIYGLVSPSGFAQAAPNPAELCWSGSMFTSVTSIGSSVFVFYYILMPLSARDNNACIEWLVLTWNNLNIEEGEVNIDVTEGKFLQSPTGWVLSPSIVTALVLMAPLSVISLFYT